MIGKHLRNYRKGMGEKFTLDYIQQKSGVPKGHLSRIENDKVSPTHSMLEKILSRVFDLPYSKVEALIAEWGVIEATKGLSEDDRSAIFQSISGDNNSQIHGSNNQIYK